MNGVDLTPETITFAFLLTAAGLTVAAGLITGTVQIIKWAIPQLFTRVTGALVAFILSIILFVIAGVAVGVDSLDEGLVVFAAWLGCATSAVGFYEVLGNRALAR